ncbi:hypothetical protein STCU_02765 [Strigomonas culicis]|uniref:Uncharacterized protein n=1 Tax=Strigomonas culicis TaxID=28005 RepID=S9UUV5_9TRYP|nr:hypothetical protein STCU_08470 [Strigomonas culicis]EPY32673.1 hypothetical protein STCU_02765 [Strigomonas culicis]|eukprot:EPY21819.1 hypothetical protein STCU_08470 [Strigomonas culicis]
MSKEALKPLDESVELPAEVAAMFFTGVNEPKPTALDFSRDGLLLCATHADDALRLLDVVGMQHTDTIQCESFGVHTSRFTQSPQVVCVAPRHPLDGHLHLLNVETAQFYSNMAYLHDLEAELRPVANTPVYSTLSACLVTDVLVAALATHGSVALFHPLVSGAIAASAEKSVVGAKPCVSFSGDGGVLAVADDHRITWFDRRMLFARPLHQIENKALFSFNPNFARAKGVDMGGGREALLTSSFGEVLVYDMERQEVVTSYFHGELRKHFIGCADALGAQYVHPHLPSSCVAMLTATVVGGRHLAVCAGPQAGEPRPAAGRLSLLLQAKDGDTPCAMAVNSRFSLVATAARQVTWWSLNV